MKSSGIKGAWNEGREYIQGSGHGRRKLLKRQSKSQKWMKKPEKVIKIAIKVNHKNCWKK